MLATTGTRRLAASKSSSVTGWPARRDMAIRCTMALVLHPMAMAQAMPFSKLARVSILAGVRSSHTISTMRRPHSALMRTWLASAAGMLEAPGSEKPTASAMPIMVAAVPMVMQVPWLRAMPASISCQAWSLNCPARRWSQILEGVRARAQHLPPPVAAQHGAGRQVDERQAHAERAHRETRRGLVAAAHQHGAVDGMAAQQLFGFHRQEVAVEHGRRLDHALGQRDRRQLQRKAARLEDAALDVVHALLEVRMALVGIAPRVDDGDDRFADPVGGRVAHLHHARAVAEGAEVVGCEPAGAAQGVVGALHRRD